MTTSTYYTITTRPNARVGTKLVDCWAAPDPRRVQISDVFEDVDLVELLAGRAPQVFVRVDPVGDPETVRDETGRVAYYQGDWRVVGAVPAAAFAGPQASEVSELLRVAALSLVADSDEEDRYHAEKDRLEEERYDARYAAEQAAMGALRRAGVDASWWEYSVPCSNGLEVIAVAARDLIGSVPGWDRAAYDLLTAPWVAAFGRI